MSETEPKQLDWQTQDVCDWFGVTRHTVARWMASEERPLPHYRPGGGHPRFNSTEVKAWGTATP